MSSNRAAAFIAVLLWITTKGEDGPEVSCVFNESCVLPCSFQSGPEPVIHWYKAPGDFTVHIYQRTQEDLSHQNQTFKGRTSLFVGQFSRGNASLLLREVKVQDEGTYKCYTITAKTVSKSSFMNLTVRASVSFVNIEQRGDELICSSKDIYPKPDVSWSPRPPPPDVEPKTSVSVSEKGLYSIFSSVILSHNPPEEHSCKISTDHSWSSATYRLQLHKIISGSEVTVLCSASNASIKSLIWKFNHNETILTQTGTNRVYNESWRQFVEEVSESGRLTLKDLNSGHHGVYSCLLISDRETHISSTEVRAVDSLSATIYAVVGVLLPVLFIIMSIVLVRWWKRRQDSQRRREIKQEQHGSSLDRSDTNVRGSCVKDHPEHRLTRSPSDRWRKVEESEQTRAPEEIPLIEQTRGNQQPSELLSQGNADDVADTNTQLLPNRACGNCPEEQTAEET